MAKGFDSFITIWENDGWFDNGTSDPFIPIVESESLKRNRMLKERNSMVRNTRAQLTDSVVIEESKAEGGLEIVPRMTDLSAILFSHFQMKKQTDTGSSYLDVFTPSKHHPTYSGNDNYGDGTYGEGPPDVYSVDIWKKIADNTGEKTTQMFKRGLCDTLTFSMSQNDDFVVGADFKFKDWSMAVYNDSPGGTNAGTYTSGTITDWRHGTWAVSTNSGTHYIDSSLEPFSSLTVDCSNNLTEKKTMGAGTRNTFNFGNYTVKGELTVEYETENWQELGTETFSLVGTVYHTDTEYLTISMPHCIVKNHEHAVKKPEEFIEYSIPFEAYEKNGTAPITVNLHTPTQGLDTDFLFWDAGSTTRTLAQYDFGDAGSTTRTLSQYDFADRDY